MKKLNEIFSENIGGFVSGMLLIGILFRFTIEYPDNYNPKSVNPREIRYRIENNQTFMEYHGIEYLLKVDSESEEIIMEKYKTYDDKEEMKIISRFLY